MKNNYRITKEEEKELNEIPLQPDKENIPLDALVSKLTKKQLEAYNYLKQAGAKAYYMPYMGRYRPQAYWYITNAPSRWTKQVEKLIELKLVKITEDTWGSKTAEAC